MRILFATCYDPSSFRGIHDYVRVLKKELETHGHQIDGLSYFPEDKAMLFHPDQYDLIHTQDPISTRALGKIKPKQVPLVSTIHEWPASGPLMADDLPEHTIVPSKRLQQDLAARWNIAEESLRVIPYGIDVTAFFWQFNSQHDPAVRREKEKYVLLCPDRLISVKGHKILIKGLSKLKEIRNDFVCYVIGNIPWREKLEQLCREKEVTGYVQFLGDRDDVPALLKISDLIVLPSLESHDPFTVMQAQVAGKPIVASNVTGISEMIQNRQTGLLYEKENSSQLAKKLERIMADATLREKMAANTSSWGKVQWSSENLYRRTIEMYLQALCNRKQFS